MGKFKTLDIAIQEAGKQGTYLIRNKNGSFSTLHGRVDVTGQWRSKPKGKRLFTPAKIRTIRRLHAKGESLRFIANRYDCSSVLVYHIVNKSIYRDVD